MKVFAVLCLAAVALAKPQGYPYDAAHTSVTERSYTIRPAAQQYYDQGYGYGQVYGQGLNYNGALTGYGLGYSAYSTAAPYTAPAYSYQSVSPVVQNVQHVSPVVHNVQHVSPVVHSVHSVAPTVVPVTAAPVAHVAHYQHAEVPVAYQTNFQYGTAVRSGYENEYNNLYQEPHVQADAKVYKHVYAFAAPEEPAQRARVVVQAPVSKRKHYKLVFIKTPSQQTVVDSDITLPAQEEEKTLIYVLSKNQKQLQPEIRIKQAEASKHAKPDVFFLKYRNEAEAQAIASGAISGETSGVPANAELISDGSVSVLGQGSAYDPALYKQNVYSGGVSQYSVGSVGVVPTAFPTVVSTPVYSAPVASVGRTTVVNIAEGTGLSRGYNANIDPSLARSAVSDDASVQIESKPEEASSYESVTPVNQA